MHVSQIRRRKFAVAYFYFYRIPAGKYYLIFSDFFYHDVQLLIWYLYWNCHRNSKCHYMDGGCLSSPRWVSLLVAEIYYPETIQPINRRPPVHRSPVMSDDPPPINDYHPHQQYLHKRAVSNNESKSTSGKKTHCDGIDELGCFQVGLDFRY